MPISSQMVAHDGNGSEATPKPS